MGAQGTTTINFGAFPGAPSAQVNVTGQTGILAGSLAEAWLYPIATADHTVDEQILDRNTFTILAANVIAGVGFTIYAQVGVGGSPLYGAYNVAWVWN